MDKISWIFLLVFLIIQPLGDLFAQDEEYSVDFIYKDKLYKTGSWWMTAGHGYGYFRKLDRSQQNFNVDLTGRFRKNYFTLGYHYSGDESILYSSGERLNDIYFGYGIRKEDLKKNFYFYAGPSYAFGYVSVPESGYAKGFRTIGLYGELQYTQKIFYDIGLGVSVFGSTNMEYQVVGAQLHIYFSTAFIDDI